MQPVFLVVERDTVVAEDIVDVIRGRVPRADIRIETSSESAARVLEQVSAIDVAILSSDVSNPDIRALAQRVRDRGGRLVVFADGEVPGDVGGDGDAVVIRKPFTSEMMMDAIWKTGDEDGAHPPQDGA